MEFSNLRYEPLADSDWARELVLRDPEMGSVFAELLAEEPERFTAVWDGTRPVALVRSAPTVETFLTLFTDPARRGQGIGSAVLSHTETLLRQGGTRRCFGFHTGGPGASFLHAHGYEPHFTSALMQRGGEPFPLEAVPVRPYRDEDYPESHALYARAFHEMRVRVGCFPESVAEPPSEAGRRSWREDAANRFVWVEDGVIAGHGHLCGSEIGSVSVKPELQGRGIGRKFVKYLCNELYRRGHAAVTLECVVGNSARSLYDSLGFRAQYLEYFVQKRLSPIQETKGTDENE